MLTPRRRTTRNRRRRQDVVRTYSAVTGDSGDARVRARPTYVDVGSVGELQSEVVGLDQIQMVEHPLVENRAERPLLNTTTPPSRTIYTAVPRSTYRHR